MKVELSIDENRDEWDTVWRNRQLRRLVNPIQLEVFPTNDEWGDIIRVDIAVDPPQFEGTGWRKDDVCPVCGLDTMSESARLAVTVYPYFSSGFSYGLPAWAHESCYVACEVVPGPAPVPW